VGAILWKYALGLELTDPGFDYSVLSEFRARLIVGNQEQVLFDKVLAHLRAQGLRHPRGGDNGPTPRTRLCAIRQLNRLEFVIETMRHAPEYASGRRARVDSGPRTCRLPCYAMTTGPRTTAFHRPITSAQPWRKRAGRMASKCWLGSRRTPPISGCSMSQPWETLQQVWQEQYTDPPEPLRWLGKHGLPAPTQQIISPYDPEARWATKRSRAWVGYKVSLPRDL
jgi:transposase